MRGYHWCYCAKVEGAAICPTHGFSLCTEQQSDDVCGNLIMDINPTAPLIPNIPLEGTVVWDKPEPAKVLVTFRNPGLFRVRDGEHFCDISTEGEQDVHSYTFDNYAVVPKEHYLELLAFARAQGLRTGREDTSVGVIKARKAA